MAETIREAEADKLTAAKIVQGWALNDANDPHAREALESRIEAALITARQQQRDADAVKCDEAAEESGKIAEQYWREGDLTNARLYQGLCTAASKSAAAIRAEGEAGK